MAATKTGRKKGALFTSHNSPQGALFKIANVDPFDARLTDFVAQPTLPADSSR
jgi:hypothetical protein